MPGRCPRPRACHVPRDWRVRLGPRPLLHLESRRSSGHKRRMLSLLIAMAAAQTVPASRPPATPSVVSLFSADDYPPTALALGWQGKVVVKLRIGIDGRVRACRIVHSSGHDELDI